MQTEECLDLSERLQAYIRENGTIEQMLDHLAQQGKMGNCERIYFGSSFCGPYFLSIDKKIVGELVEFCQQRKIHLGLVVPTFTEKNLVKGKEKLREYMRWLGTGIDEVVVNDYGMLRHVHEQYDEMVSLAMGRLFMKDYRDPRYQDFFNEEYGPAIFTDELKKLVEAYQVRAMLFDATHRQMNFKHKPKGMKIGIYTPYTYITMGQICEPGSEHQPLEKKFRPNGICQLECNTEEMHYFVDDGRKWLRVGRTIYYENKDVCLSGLEAYRRIYCPFERRAEQ